MLALSLQGNRNLQEEVIEAWVHTTVVILGRYSANNPGSAIESTHEYPRLHSSRRSNRNGR